MKIPVLLLLLIVPLSGPAEKQPRLECTVKERGPAGRTYKLSAELSNPEPNGIQDFHGKASYSDGTRDFETPVSGVYLAETGARKLELIGFSDSPTGDGKLNFAVQPDHPVLRRRSTKAVVLTGDQTVENGTPADVTCRTVEP